MMFPRRFSVLALLLFVSACSVRDAACGKPAPETAQQAPSAPAVAIAGNQAEPADTTIRIAFLGDSLTAGLGLLSDRAFPALLQQRLIADGYDVEAINAGLSGDTTAGGLRRVDQLLDGSTKILVVALGANDALRGLTVQETRENLRQIIDLAHSKGATVMLCGMQAPTNLGSDYQDAFRQLYFDLLRDYQRKIIYVPFLLEGVAGVPALNQADGMHPNEAGSKVIAELLYPNLRAMVDRVGG